MNNKYLFLDFDGVLHPGTTSFSDKANHFSSAIELTDLLSSCPCEIIISSSWRFSYSLDELKKLLPINLSHLVKDTTGDAFKGEFARFNEIKTYLLHKNKSLNNWRALDDAGFEFPQNCENLILCNHATGIKQPQIEELRAWLQN